MDGSLRIWFAITYGIAGARRSRYARAAAQCRAQSVIGSPAADAQVAAVLAPDLVHHGEG